MIISFLIQENEIFAYKIIHIPVKYLCTRKILFIFGTYYFRIGINIKYILDSGHFIDLYIDRHSIEATARPR